MCFHPQPSRNVQLEFKRSRNVQLPVNVGGEGKVEEQTGGEEGGDGGGVEGDKISGRRGGTISGMKSGR